MVKRKNMRTSAITEVSYNPTAKIDLAMIEKRKMQYGVCCLQADISK